MSGLVFQGTSALSLDGKGRLTVPVRHRELLVAAAAGQLTLTKHPVGCLLVFPRPVWESFRERLLSLAMAADGWRRVFIGSAVDVELDGNSRIHVSPELRAAAGLDKDLLWLGVGRQIELWDPARYAAHEADTVAGGMPEAVQSFVF